MENESFNHNAIFGSSKPFDYWLNKEDNPLVYCLLHMDGKKFLAGSSYEVILHQKTNKHDCFTIRVPNDAIDEFKDFVMTKSRQLIGNEILINYHQYGKIRQSFFGIIDKVQDRRDGSGYGDIVLKGKSPAILLDSGKKCTSFTNKTLEEIIHKVCENYPRDAKIKVTSLSNSNISKIIPYTVQYQESDYQFIQRLAKLHGQYFYYNGETLIFGTETQPTIKIGEGIDLDKFHLKMKLKAQLFSYQAYDAEAGTDIEKQAEKSEINHAQNTENIMQAVAIIKSEKVFPKTSKMYFNNTGNDAERDLKAATIRKKERLLRLVKVKGESRNINLRIGGLIEVSDINRKAMETYRVIEVKHIHDPGEYYNTFIAIPDMFQAPYQDNNALPKGEEQSARVIDNNDPLGMKRVRVQFSWQKDTNETTPWIEVVSPYTGAGKGHYFTPEIGEEVLVAFRNGNAENPYVAGALYNGAEVSGYATPNNDLKVIKTRSGHTIIMNDSEDKMSITILDQSGNTIYLDTVKKSITITAPETIDIICKNLNIKVEENMKTTVGHNQENTIGKNIKTVAKEEISQDSGKKTIIASGDNTEISAKRDLDLYGKKNLIGFTDGKTEFGAKEQMHVYGANSLITAKDKIEYKAPQMNKLAENGKFKYDKEKQIVSVKWMDDKANTIVTNAGIGDKVSIMVQTRNYEIGEAIQINVKEVQGKEVEEGKTSVPYSGKIDENGLAILKREIEIKESPEEEAKKAKQEKLEEEKKSKEIYKTIDGKDFTFNEWKEYEQKAWEEYQKNKKK